MRGRKHSTSSDRSQTEAFAAGDKHPTNNELEKDELVHDAERIIVQLERRKRLDLAWAFFSIWLDVIKARSSLFRPFCIWIVRVLQPMKSVRSQEGVKGYSPISATMPILSLRGMKTKESSGSQLNFQYHDSYFGFKAAACWTKIF